MSVLIRKLGADNLELVMKGAPETIQQYCKRDTGIIRYQENLILSNQNPLLKILTKNFAI